MKNALFVMVVAVGFVGCGEESSPPGGGSVTEGEGEGVACKGDAVDGCPVGEGEGSHAEGEGSSEGEGHSEGEGPVAGEGEGAPAECPQIAGTWFAHFPEVRRADGQEYDFSQNVDSQFWEDQEVTFEQDGCTIRGPDRNFLWDDGGTGEVRLSPLSFSYVRMWEDMDGNRNHPLRSTGQISADGKSVSGTCAGEYRNWSDLTLFNITCTFTLTRRG